MPKPNYNNVIWYPEAKAFAESLGLDDDIVMSAIKNPESSTLDAKSHAEGYPVVNHRRGDVVVTVGYRDSNEPAILHVKVNAMNVPVSMRGNTAGKTGKGGGGSGTDNPKSWRHLRSRVIEMGYRFERGGGGHDKVIDRETGTVIFSLPTSPSDYRSLPNSWTQFKRAHAAFKSKPTIANDDEEGAQVA